MTGKITTSVLKLIFHQACMGRDFFRDTLCFGTIYDIRAIRPEKVAD